MLICVADPVPETRDLLARLVARRGHRTLIWDGPTSLSTLPEGSLDALLFEPTSSHGRAACAAVREHHARALRIAIGAASGHDGHVALDDPFTPAQLAAILDAP